MPFKSEADFENAFIAELQQHGWGEHAVIQRPTEAQLLQNWADILYDNNKGRDFSFPRSRVGMQTDV